MNGGQIKRAGVGAVKARVKLDGRGILVTLGLRQDIAAPENGASNVNVADIRSRRGIALGVGLNDKPPAIDSDRTV